MLPPKTKDCVCIYCGRGEGETPFGSREHVIPELLGVFTENLTLIGWVCNHCNSEVFSPLEVRFKEDTEEGISCQMMNFSGSHQIRVRNTNSIFSFTLPSVDPFFNNVFPFLKKGEDEWNILFVPQIRINNYCGTGFIILVIDRVQALPRNGQKWRKLKNILSTYESKDVSIFTHGEEGDRTELDKAIKLVKELGIEYKPGTEKHNPFIGDGTDNQRAEVAIDITVGSDTARILAKIAFNYFAYCAITSGQENFLYHENFAKIKSYILGQEEIPLKEIIIEKPSYSPLTFDEAGRNSRLVGHMVTLSVEDNNLISQVTFGGRLVYKILLGELPGELRGKNLGNGHLFDPFQKVIVGMTRNSELWGSNMPLTFTLFNDV